MTFDEWWNDYVAGWVNEYLVEKSAAKRAWQAATLAEREDCAKVCELRYMGDNNREDMEAKRCADAIRARSNEGENDV